MWNLGQKLTTNKSLPYCFLIKLYRLIRRKGTIIRKIKKVILNKNSLSNRQGRYVLFNNLKKDYPHLKTMLSVGGSKMSKDFNAVTSTPDARSKFAANSVEYVRKWGFDGIDLDWEYPGQGGGSKHALAWLVQVSVSN